MKKSMYLVLLLLGTLHVFAQKNKPITLKVMTYNIHHGESEQGKSNLNRVVELIKKHKPDLVALQEIDSVVTRSGKVNQMNVLSLLTGYKAAFSDAIELQGGKYGLGILSKYPIESVQKLKLPNPEDAEPRILMCALVPLSDSKYVRFCNTHLDHRSALGRGLQAAVINENLQNSIYPVIVGGDFNATADDHTLEAMTKYWNDAGKNTDGGTLPDANKRIDYFWTHQSSGFKMIDYKVLYEPQTSDHYPVIVTYKLGK